MPVCRRRNRLRGCRGRLGLQLEGVVQVTNLEVIEMLKEMQEKTAGTKGFFIGHVTQLWVIKELLGSKIAELEGKGETDGTE